MNSESLDEALAFLDAALEQPQVASDNGPDYVSSLVGDDWDHDELLASIDVDIGDFRMDSGPSEAETQSHNAPDPSTGVKHPLKTKKRRKKQSNSNKARDERRFEVIRLRREVEDLDLTLKQLEDIRNQSGGHVYSIQKESDASGVPAVWQEICGRQLSRRLKAERENMELKKRHEEEMRVVKSIEKMLFKRMASHGVAQAESSKHTRRTNLPAEYIKRVAAFIFDELATSVEVSYREVEGLFQPNSTVPNNVVTHQPLLRGGMKGMYKKLFDKRTVPFGLEETGDAWWRHWHNYRGQRVQDVTSNVVTESFGLEMVDLKTSTSATSYGQQILRRHVEENRIVYVWNAYIEPFVFENKPVSGVYLLEQSHVLIKPEEEGSKTDKDSLSTSMSTCYVITPHYLDPKLKDDAKTTALIDFLLSALSSNITARNETVENLLLDQALQKHHNGP
ncbi:hypothetical protein PRNP1_011260 [Phytophthora ramorum]